MQRQRVHPTQVAMVLPDDLPTYIQTSAGHPKRPGLLPNTKFMQVAIKDPASVQDPIMSQSAYISGCCRKVPSLPDQEENLHLIVF